MSTVTIRPATLDDLPAIVAMRDDLNRLELAGCAHASIRKLTLDQFRDEWAISFADPAYCWRIVQDGDRPVGYGLIYLSPPRKPPLAAFVHWAYLDETHRSRGAGRLLFESLLEWARAQGASRIELQFIEGNVGAERFWKKLGFRPYAFKCVRYLDETGG